LVAGLCLGHWKGSQKSPSVSIIIIIEIVHKVHKCGCVKTTVDVPIFSGCRFTTHVVNFVKVVDWGGTSLIFAKLICWSLYTRLMSGQVRQVTCKVSDRLIVPTISSETGATRIMV